MAAGAGRAHAWPEELPLSVLAHFGSGHVQVTVVEPFAVSVEADQSFEHGPFGNVTRFVRAGPELDTRRVVGPRA